MHFPKIRCAVLLGCLTVGAGARLPAQRFTDVTSDAGIAYQQFESAPRGGFQTYMSGGAAAGDFDGDGWIDLYVTRLDAADILYRNQGDGTFADVTEAAFGKEHLANVMTNGVGWADIDNDDDLDLYVTSLFSNGYQLFINDGQGTFREEANARNAGIAGIDEHFGFSVSFGDYDRDGFLDIHTTEWRRAAQNKDESPQNTRLLRNLGSERSGYFEDVTVAAGVAMDGVTTDFSDADSQAFTSRFEDFDRDGWSDLAIASDHGTSRLFWNNGDGTFLDGTQQANVGNDQFGMGSATGDVDGDGDIDWFVTSIYKPHTESHTGNRLYLNNGDRTFDDSMESVRDGGWGWGTVMIDADNDGDLDLLEANGQSFPFTDIASEFNSDAIRLWENNEVGVLTENAAAWGLDDTSSGKGLLAFDYDNDGDLDLFVSNNGAAPLLYRNDTDTAHSWLQVETIGTVSNRQGVGALVWLDPDSKLTGDEQSVVVSASSNFLSQSPALAHFGLGSHDGDIDVIEIHWPSGSLQQLRDVPINRRIAITEIVPEPCGSRVAPCMLWLLTMRKRRRNA